MSDAVMSGQTVDRRRMLVSMAAALLLHCIAVLVLILGVGSRIEPLREPPVTIDVQIASAPAGPVNAGSGGVAVPSYAPASLPAASAGGGGGASGTGDFVIPTPRGTADPSAPIVPSASGFREAGGRTGATGNLPSVQEQSSAAAVPPVQSGKGTGAGAGTGSGSVQHSGTGVAVGGAAGTGTGGKLDLSQLDKAISGTGTSGSGTGRAGGGSGQGTGTQAGTGSGTGTVKGGGGGSGTGSYSVVWDQPDASKGRNLTSAPSPTMPPWVSSQGLTLRVTVAFTLTQEGVISKATVEQSSGYADVDAAVVDAIRRWRFSPSKAPGTVNGVIPYVIKAG
jgi:TonB family protein